MPLALKSKPEFAPSMRETIANSFSSKPRCCEWCEKRGWKDTPLVRLYVESDRLTPGKPDDFKWWVHKDCADIILEDETISAFLLLPGY